MKILKWKLELLGRQELQVPAGATFLSVQAQAGSVCIWMLCDEQAEITEFSVVMHPTGEGVPRSISEPDDYLGTVQLYGGKLVLHFFGWFAE